jgi:hypothetical protein
MDRADAIQASFARKWRFEAAHLDVTIVVPGGVNDRWRAVVPLSDAPEGSGGTLGAPDLEELMDQLEEIYQDETRPGPPEAPD